MTENPVLYEKLYEVYGVAHDWTWLWEPKRWPTWAKRLLEFLPMIFGRMFPYIPNIKRGDLVKLSLTKVNPKDLECDGCYFWLGPHGEQVCAIYGSSYANVKSPCSARC